MSIAYFVCDESLFEIRPTVIQYINILLYYICMAHASHAYNGGECAIYFYSDKTEMSDLRR